MRDCRYGEGGCACRGVAEGEEGCNGVEDGERGERDVGGDCGEVSGGECGEGSGGGEFGECRVWSEGGAGGKVVTVMSAAAAREAVAMESV